MSKESGLTEADIAIQKRAQEILDMISKGNIEENIKLLAVLCADMEDIIETQAQEIKQLKK